MDAVILAIVGAVLSLIFTYVPTAKVWLDAYANKGLIMLGFVVLVSLVYFGLACSPFATDLNINLACTQAGAFELARAVFVIASTNQLTYLFTRKGS